MSDTEMRLVDGIPRSYTTADNVENFTNDSGTVAVGDAVYISAAGKVSKASNTVAAQECIGLVFEVTDATNCRVITRGLLDNFSTGMTPNTRYYLGSTAGSLTTTKPTGQAVVEVVGIAYNATDLMICPQIGITDNPGVSNLTLDGTYDNSGGESYTITTDAGPIILRGASTALRFNDDVALLLGTDGDALLSWSTTTYAFETFLLQGGGGQGFYFITDMLIGQASESGGNLAPLDAPNGGSLFYAFHQAGSATNDHYGIVSELDNSAGTARTSSSSSYPAFEARLTGNSGDTNSTPYTAFSADNAVSSAGAGKFIGLSIGTGYTESLRIASGTAYVNDGVGLSFGTDGDVNLSWGGSSLEVIPLVDNTDWNWGDGTSSLDMKWFGNSASTYFEWSSATNTLSFVNSAQIVMADDSPIYFGSSSDSFIYYSSANNNWYLDNSNTTSSTIIQLGTNTTATSFIIEKNTEADIFRVYGDGGMTWAATGGGLTWSASSNLVQWLDSTQLVFGGDTDVSLYWDNSTSRMQVVNAVENTNWHWGLNSGGSASTDLFDMVWWASGTPGGGTGPESAYIFFDPSNRQLYFRNTYLQVADQNTSTGANTGIHFGDSDDAILAWNGGLLCNPLLADSSFAWGSSTYQWTMTWYGSTSSNTMVFNGPSDILQLDGVDLRLQDNDLLYFGNSNDIQMQWDGSKMLVLPLTDGYDWHWGNGTLSIDHVFYGSSSANFMSFVSASNYLNFEGVDLWLEDDDQIQMGDAGTSDSYITWTGSTSEWLFNNNNATGSTVFQLGTDDSATEWRVENNSGDVNLLVRGDGVIAQEFTCTETAGITAGMLVSLSNTGNVLQADQNSASAFRKRPIGIALETASNGNPIKVAVYPGNQVQTYTDLSGMTNGDPLYMAATLGDVTNVQPGSGLVYLIGWVSDTTTDLMTMNIQYVSGTIV